MLACSIALFSACLLVEYAKSLFSSLVDYAKSLFTGSGVRHVQCEERWTCGVGGDMKRQVMHKLVLATALHSFSTLASDNCSLLVFIHILAMLPLLI